MTQQPGSVSDGLAPGAQIAGYQVLRQIGRGGMAVVYRALDLRLGRQVALKVLAPQLSQDDAFRQRFIRESRAAAGVDHPHIVPVFEAGEADGVLFLAMCYVSHGDVRMLLDREGRLPVARALAITAQVASALDAAHARGLVHRDVKPANMLLAQTGAGSDHVYLSDFGLSKHSLAASTLTTTGQFMGTLNYVSPEQIQGHRADGRADQYALACTVVEMLSGSTPFHRDETMALLWAKLEVPPPSLTRRRPDLPPAVDRVIATALARAPAGRYRSCLAFASALSAACAGRQADAPAHPNAAPADRLPVRGPAPPTRQDWPPDRPVTRQDTIGRTAAATGRDAWSGDSGEAPEPLAAGHAWPLRRPRRARQRRARQRRARQRRMARHHRVYAAVLALLLVAVLAVAGVLFARHEHAGTPPGSHAGSATAGPGHVVTAYFDAINQRDYLAAWRLTGDPGSFRQFAAGFAGTAWDQAKILTVRGDVVTVSLAAHQVDGTVKRYSGTYTVTNGVISSANMRALGS